MNSTYADSKTTSERIAESVLDYYLESPDFNGIPLCQIVEVDGDEGSAVATVRSLVKDGVLEIISSEWELNPSIRRFRPSSADRQLASLQSKNHTICLFPTSAFLQRRVAPYTDLDRPFTRRLRFGDAQLDPVFFDLSVLERYHADPRYQFDFDDIEGWIGLRDGYYESDQMAPRDKIFLQSFGVGRDADGQRVIAVFLRYLHALTPEHQRHWEGHVHSGTCKLHPEYLRTSIIGDWAETISVYEAFLEELFHINEMLARIGYPPLFRDTFYGKRPRDFGLILRPTRRNYYQFVHLLDKMIADNLNRAFFRTVGLRLEEEIPRKRGRTEVRNKKTLRLLDEWLRNSVRVNDAEVFSDISEPLRKVNDLRNSKSAHTLHEDDYDLTYHELQDELIEGAYTAVRLIRQSLANDPALRDYEIPEWLHEGKISVY